jgi:hypothetical protein
MQGIVSTNTTARLTLALIDRMAPYRYCRSAGRMAHHAKPFENPEQWRCAIGIRHTLGWR